MKRLLRPRNGGGKRGGNSEQETESSSSSPSPHHLPSSQLSSSSSSSRTRSADIQFKPPATLQQTQAQTQTQQSFPPRVSKTVRSLNRGFSAPDSSSKNGVHHDHHHGGDGLPSAWDINDRSLRHSDPLCITMSSSTLKTTVYSEVPIPNSLFLSDLGITRRKSNDDTCLDPDEQQEGGIAPVYYFEVSVVSTTSNSNSNKNPSSHPAADISIGFFGGADTLGVWPGEIPNSIGWGADGLLMNGRLLDADQRTQLRHGDVIGCGVELGGRHRVFFTWNGALVVPPSATTAFHGSKDLPWYPVASFRHGTGDVLRGNFGRDATNPFRWPGSDRWTITPSQMVLTSAPTSTAGSRSRAHTLSSDRLPASSLSSSYYPRNGLESSSPLSTGQPGYLMRSMPAQTMGSPPSNFSYTGSTTTNSSSFGPTSQSTFGDASKGAPSYYGVQNHRRNLVDDDPAAAEVAAAMNDHLTLNASPTHSQNPHNAPSAAAAAAASQLASPYRMQSAPAYSYGRHDGSNEQMMMTRTTTSPGGDTRREHRRHERANRRSRIGGAGLSSGGQDGSTDYSTSPIMSSGIAPSSSSLSPEETGQASSTRLPMMLPTPRSATNAPSNRKLTKMQMKSLQAQKKAQTRNQPQSNNNNTNNNDMVVAVATAAVGNEIPIAKEHAAALLETSKQSDAKHETLLEMLETCKADQEKLQLKLSNALEEADAIENLEELFAVNDGICSAIEVGKEALKRTQAHQKKKKKNSGGPTIELLTENEDIFSLICMLRAPNDKRREAAAALMKFARENEALRNEIRSSGGMHSFLTLFRTKGSSTELKVISSMAVAYVLPSFVVSSQTSSSVGLKIVECLRFLVVTNPVSTDELSISRLEMLKAASMGVNVLWINAIQPLLIIESTKDQPTQTRPALRPSASLRMNKVRGRAGGGIFDQGQESIEIRELTELAVTLITHVAKISGSRSENPLDVGFNIVEQVCEVDAARPIAVREGLLTTLVDWIRSKDIEKVRPAASALRYLISIDDRYMAGWIHSQVVNEGAVSEIVKLLNESVGHDVRVAVAQMISALCIAPHTRAAVVEARCVGYLVALLYEHSSPTSEEMVRYAASALLQLAAGAMVRATALSMNGVTVDAATPDQQETVITEILEGWAHGSFVQIVIERTGKLRSVSVEALRVLSEDTDQIRQTRLQLCSVGAAGALGKTLKDDRSAIISLRDPDNSQSDFDYPESALFLSVKDVHEALRGLANILEPQKESSKPQLERHPSGAHPLNPKEMLIKACLDMVKSGGLDCVIRISSLPYSPSPPSGNLHTIQADRMDLLDESCRLLANISPLLLTDAAASEGCAGWASSVYDALHGILVRLDYNDDGDSATDLVEINVDALKGLGALARYEPLKIRIVDKSLPKLLALKSLSGAKNDLSNAASQVLLSLGFTEDEITVQVAGNNPKLLVDWFCMQRALLLQAMARAELRARVVEMWQLPFGDIDIESTEILIRQTSAHSNFSSGSDDRSEGSHDNLVMQGLFENFTKDRESRETRESIVQQYQNVYMNNVAPNRSSADVLLRSGTLDATHRVDSNEGIGESLLKSHVFPLNDSFVEKDWILSHNRGLESTAVFELENCPVGVMPERIEKLLDCCFPSRVLRNDIIPFNDLRPNSSFNFRALMMPQRRYFSFRREGQLLARLCEKQAGLSDTDEIFWSLGFTNSTFAGEFVESLVQTLYLCPMITGLSFSRNADWLMMRDTETECEGEEGGGILANLAGSLPPWVSNLTFDNVLQDRDLRALVAIIDTMGKLSSGGDFAEGKQFDYPSVGQSQGKFSFVGIRNCPQISRESWSSFFSMLGKSGPAKRGPNSMPLSSLTILDLSGNKLGDDIASLVLELVHDKDSGCNLEQLDLSGNRIGRGTNVVRVLRSYTEYYRYNQKLGAKVVRSGWKSSLHTLVLADNDLFLGQAGLEICALLKHNALYLRFLDLSNNGLEGETYQLLASSLLKNTSLCHLDLSSNKFSAPLIDLILENLNGSDTEKSLSFLLLENNSPPLSPPQRRELGKFLRKSRKNAIIRMVKEKEVGSRGPDELTALSLQAEQHDGGLALISEDNVADFEPSLAGNRRSHMATGNDTLLGDDEGDNKITVLFSAPLVFADDANKLHAFAKLDFDMERELLWQCMKEASRDIELSFDNAHHSRLLATLTKRCSCLHYSGHGHPHFLPFEDGMGGPNWLNVQDIKELIVRDGAAPFKFVFVSACHSGLAGETFASAGVPHVVCCQQEEELKDTAALAFTRSFYLALAVGNTVKESFEQGCKAVRATPNLKDPEQEMEKFVLLPKNGNHDVPVFRAKSVREWPKQPRNHGFESSKSRRRSLMLRSRSAMVLGAKSSELGTRNMMQDDPSPSAPQFFIGREVDMYYLLTALLKMKKRLVNVLGEPGIGRSSLVCGLCHYINERASTVTDIQHIYFIKPKHGGRNVSCRSLLRQLLDKLQEAGKSISIDDDTEVEGMLDAISKSLKSDKALIVFDRTELLENSDDGQDLPMILSTLLYDTKQVKVLLTGKHSLGQPSIGGQVEHPYKLGPLNFANSVRLFGNLCPHLHTPSERGLFFSELIQESMESSQLFPSDAGVSDRVRAIFSDVGDGIPAKIEKAAYSISKEDLNKLRAGRY